MQMRPFALPLLLIPGVANAEVTPQDVWDNLVAGYGSVGIELTATLETAGDTLIANDGVAKIGFPVVGGGITATLPPMTFTDQGDGTVAIGTPQTYLSVITAEIPDEPDTINMDVTFAMSEISSIANGDPGDVVYTAIARDFDILVSNLALPDTADDVDVSVQFESEGYDSITRITVADSVTITNDTTNLPSVFSFTVTDGDLVQESSGEGGTLVTSLTTIIPQGTDIMNLSPALANGFLVSLASKNEGSTTRSTSTIDGDMISSQSQAMLGSETIFNLSADGLQLSSLSDGGAFDMEAGGFMPPIAVTVGPSSGAFVFPVMGSDEPQPFQIQMAISELAVDDSLWSMIDPMGGLDRSPATLSFNLTGELTNSLDIFSPDTMEILNTTGMVPIEPNTLDIADVIVSALGANITMNGAFTFDNSDLQTFNGLPRPEGSATARASGLNAAIDQLIAAGLISEQDIGMGRMFMGMFAVAEGDDVLSTELEVNAEGHVLLNGQRVQ